LPDKEATGAPAPHQGVWEGALASYLGELREHGRPLAAASLGVSVSLPLFAYTNSVFAPHLIADFGWSRSQFALVGLTLLATLPFLPVIGRLTDKLGVRKVALTGTLLLPLCFLAYSLMTGSFAVFLVLFTLVLILAGTTSTLVFTRLIAENFVRAQGLALTIVNCAPAVLAMALIPGLNMMIVAIGWRTSYLVLGGFCLVVGLIAIALTPPGRPKAETAEKVVDPFEGSARRDYGVILRSRVFWIIIIAMFLCLLQTQLHSSQMNIMLLEQDLTTQGAANIVSIYAFGTIVGRIACGLALDRYTTPIVTFVSMIIPAIGFFLLGTELDAFAIVALSMFLIGLSVGAESDLISFLIARYFKLRIYNTTLSLAFVCSFLASAVGSLAVSWTLGVFDSFAPFLFFISGAIVVGSFLFLLLPRSRSFPKVG
jgi:MFS family permease